MTMPEVLWRPSAERVERAGITRFRRWLQETRGLGFNGYEALWNWSVEDLAGFWRALHDWSGACACSPKRRCRAPAGSRARR